MKRVLTTLALTCVLSVSAMAGDIPTCGPSPAVQPPPSAVVTVIVTILSFVAK